jgi:hypothetical protein
MRDIKRIKRICKKLETAWSNIPDQRLGQLLENYIFTKGKRGDDTSYMLFSQEDDETERLLDYLSSLNPKKRK